MRLRTSIPIARCVMRLLGCLAVGALILAAADPAPAQSRSSQSSRSSPSLFGSSGPTSQSTLGGTRSRTQSTGGGSLGNVGMPTGSSLIESTSTATDGFVGLNNSQPRVGSGGGMTGQQRSRTRTGGRTNTFQRNQGTNRNEQFNQNDNGGMGGRGGLGATQTQPKIQHRIGFSAPTRPATTISSTLQGQFAAIGERHPLLSGVTVEVGEGGNVTLRGSVPSAEAQRLAAALVRLEPGVRSVDDETVVASPGGGDATAQ